MTLAAVILAAGSGSRLRTQGVQPPKPLVSLGGLTLLERALRAARRAGAADLIAVIGCDAERVRAEVEPRVRDLNVRWVVSRDWAEGNGASLLAARDAVSDRPFLVLMSDHVFLPGLLEGLAGARPPEAGAVMAVDRKFGLLADPDDATKVRLDGALVTDVGKQLKPCDAIDTGASLCTAAIFAALAACREQTPGRCAHGDAMKRLAGEGRLLAHDVGAARWEDVDDRRAFAAAEELLFDSLRKPTDGLISRLLERRLSLSVTKLLCRTEITPNQVTVCVVAIGLASAWLFSLPGEAAKQAGALVFWCASFLDGCDGELARLKFKASRLGGLLDFWSDNVVHMAVFAAMGVGLFRDTGRWHWLVLGAAASLGVLISAGWVYWTSVRPKGAYSSVAAGATTLQGWRAALARAADHLSRRDFIFWLNFIVLAGGLPYFLWAAAIGSHLFALSVVVLALSAGSEAAGAKAPRSRWMVLATAALGLAACVLLFKRLDASAVAAQLARVDWTAALAAPAALLWLLPNTLGWACAIAPPAASPGLARLFAIRLSGEAVNAVLPSGYLGGEPLKVAALARWLPAAAATSSVAVAKAAQTAALLAFIAAGVALAAHRAPLSPTLLRAIAGVCILLSAGVLALLLLPASGLLSRAAGLGGRGGGPRWPALAHAAQSFEAAQRAFVRAHKARFGASVALHFVGWSAGAIEVWILARALGAPLGLDDAFVLASLAMGISVAGFFLPAMLGSFEAGHVAGAAAVGLAPELGLSIALLRRAREAFLIAVGLLAAWRLALWKPRAAGGTLKVAAVFTLCLALSRPAAAQTERPTGVPAKPPPVPAAPAAGQPLIIRWMIRPLHRSMLITLPIVETDPNRGVTTGVMPILVRQGERDDRIRRIHAPSVTYNSIFGVTSTYRYYVYPTDKASFTGFLSASQTANRNLFVKYDDADFMGRGVFIESKAQWAVDGSKRFFGIGPDSERRNQTNYAEKTTHYDVRVGLPLSASRRWRASLGHRLAGQRVAAGPVDSLPDTARLFPQNVPARWHQDAELRAGVDFDTRDHPVTTSRGQYARVYAGNSQRAFGSEFDFQRYGADLRTFVRSSRSSRRVTAIQARFEQLLGTAPFYLMPQLGGKYVHRAYGAGRYVDKGLGTITVEERMTVYSLAVAGVTTEVEFAPFAGVGTVFSSPGRAAARYARPVFGAAVRAVARPQVVGSIDVGIGQEGPVAFMDINYSF